MTKLLQNVDYASMLHIQNCLVCIKNYHGNYLIKMRIQICISTGTYHVGLVYCSM